MKIDKQSFQQIRKDREAADLTLTKCNHFLTSVTEQTFFFFCGNCYSPRQTPGSQKLKANNPKLNRFVQRGEKNS